MDTVSTLPSGLRLVTHHQPAAETISIGLFIDAGTRDERAGEEGLAHFLEHMAFKGTHRRSAFQTVAEIEALGGDINAETSHETTTYSVRMLADDWRTGLDVLLDIATAPRFDASDIALEKDVVCQEIAGSLDVPDDRVGDGIGMAAFAGQALGQPILGDDETVSALTADRLSGFRARRYASAVSIVSVAGPIEHAEIERALVGAAPSFPAHGVEPRAAAHFTTGRFVEARDSFDTHLALAWEAPAYAAEDAIAHALAIQILGGGMTSRLFQAVREEAGLAYTIDAYPLIYADCGLGVVQTATGAHQVGEVKQRIVDEIRRLADDMSEHELQNAKRQFRASLAMSAESLSGLAARNARQLSVLGALRSRATLEEMIENASLSRVRDCWTRVASDMRLAHSAVGPSQALDLWLD